PSSAVRASLMRAFTPELYNARLTGRLITDSSSNHPAVAAAAMDKLVELGNRNYRVIQALLNAAQTGTPGALEPVGWIGDRRAISDLEHLFRQQKDGPLKRASFLALEALGAPYLERRETVCAWMPTSPDIDGRIVSEEWTRATQLDAFSTDSLSESAPHNMIAWVAHDTTHLYLALTCDFPDTLQAAIQTRDEASILQDCQIEWTLSPDGQIPYVFSVNPLGVVLDRHGENPNWDPRWQAAAGRTPGKLTVECAIPLAAFGLTPSELRPIRFNLAQILRTTGLRRWTWSVTYGSPDNPARYGDMAFSGAP
ncbi:MAG: hypothetical protein O2954_18525, partial [bacterium]|nr:hypothetical protein [bacterium]